MDYTNPFVKANADDMYAVSDVERWLKDLERNGATMADFNTRIKILQAVAAKMPKETKLDLKDVDVRETYIETLAFRPDVFGI